MLRTQPNARIHAVATLLVVVAGAFMPLSSLEWCALVFAIVTVWAAEAFNTALEFPTDLASPDFHVLAGHTKDVAAGAVLIVALGACLVGLQVFWPHVAAWW